MKLAANVFWSMIGQKLQITHIALGTQIVGTSPPFFPQGQHFERGLSKLFCV